MLAHDVADEDERKVGVEVDSGSARSSARARPEASSRSRWNTGPSGNPRWCGNPTRKVCRFHGLDETQKTGFIPRPGRGRETIVWAGRTGCQQADLGGSPRHTAASRAGAGLAETLLLLDDGDLGVTGVPLVGWVHREALDVGRPAIDATRLEHIGHRPSQCASVNSGSVELSRNLLHGRCLPEASWPCLGKTRNRHVRPSACRRHCGDRICRGVNVCSSRLATTCVWRTRHGRLVALVGPCCGSLASQGVAVGPMP